MNDLKNLYEDLKLETCLLVNYKKSVSLSPIIFNDNFKTTSVSFFIADLNLLSCVNLRALHLNCCIVSFYTGKNETYLLYCIYKTFTIPCGNSKTVSFASSRMKWNLVFFALSKFAVKLIC